MASTLDAYAGLTRRRYLALGLLSAGLLLSLLLDLSAGPAGLGIGDILGGIVDPESLDIRHRVILWQVRLPDALIAVVVGAALGLAGVETQTILDNPLASPFTLGVSSAAVLGASVAIVLSPAMPLIPQTATLPALALVFALGGGAVILAVVRFGGGARETVVLFGIAMVFLCNALTSALHYVADADALQQIVFWTIGNLTRAGWWEVAIVTACVAVIAPFSLRHVWWMTMLRGGEAYARSAGLDVARLRVQVVLRTSVLAAFAVCFVGSIGSHIARLLLGEDHRALVPGAAICGALMLSAASFLSKSVLPGAIVPVGILTAVIGVPVFLTLLAVQRRMR